MVTYPMALYIKGQVYNNGIYFVGSKVRLYLTSSKILVEEVLSSTNGYYTFTVSDPGPYFIVAIIDTGGEYNALIWADIVPIPG